MKVLWLLNFVPPFLAKDLELAAGASGSWVTGLLNSLQNRPDCPELILAFFYNGEGKLWNHRGLRCAALPRQKGQLALKQLLNTEQPDLCQLFGTEGDHARWLFEVCPVEKILVYIQGLASPCGIHMADGLPDRFLRSQPLKEFLALKTGGRTVRQQKELLLEQGGREQQLLGHSKQLLGRTDWDKAYCARFAPEAQYHHLDEIMRPEFYAGGWNRSSAQPHRIFVSQGNLPLKGLHRVIEALPALCERWPDTEVYVAGWPPPDHGALLRPFMRWLVEYPGYLDKLSRKLGVWEHIHYTGVLNAAQMQEQFLLAETFVLSSSVENSPNSLGEAMLTGIPCVSAAVGGVPSLLSNKEGVLFDPEIPGALADAVASLWCDPAKADQLAAAGQKRARVTHDPDRIAKTQLLIYQQLSGNEPLE